MRLEKQRKNSPLLPHESGGRGMGRHTSHVRMGKENEVEPQRLWTIGYLVKKNKKVVKIATTKDEKGEWYGFHAFPTGCVVSIKDAKDNHAEVFVE